MLLTNDGDLAHRLMHPRYGVLKTYLADVPGPVDRDLGRRLMTGIELEDGVASADKFRVVERAGSRALVEITVARGAQAHRAAVAGGGGASGDPVGADSGRAGETGEPEAWDVPGADYCGGRGTVRGGGAVARLRTLVPRWGPCPADAPLAWQVLAAASVSSARGAWRGLAGVGHATPAAHGGHVPARRLPLPRAPGHVPARSSPLPAPRGTSVLARARPCGRLRGGHECGSEASAPSLRPVLRQFRAGQCPAQRERVCPRSGPPGGPEGLRRGVRGGNLGNRLWAGALVVSPPPACTTMCRSRSRPRPRGLLGVSDRSGTADAPTDTLFAGRRDNGCDRRAHSGHAPRLAGPRLVCWRCWGLRACRAGGSPGPGDGLRRSPAR